MLVAGGTDISADVRVLKSASPFWWSLLCSCSFVLHFLYLAHKAGVCACICRCGHPDMYGLSFVISGGYRSQKAAQRQLWAIIVRERSGKELVAEDFGKEVSWQLQNLVTFSVWTTEWAKSNNLMEGFIYIFIYIHRYAVLTWMERTVTYINTWILWDDLDWTVLEQ